MELKSIIEAILFNAQKPLSIDDMRHIFTGAAAEAEEESPQKAFKKIKADDIAPVLEALKAEHEAAKRSFKLVCVAGMWQFVSEPECAPWLRTMFGAKARPPRLTQASLETLAIIAYRQPLTRAEMEQIRGVAVDGVMQTLIDRGLVVQSGRAEVIGRPALYCTTPAFLEYFGLASLEHLPAADELRRVEIKKPEALQTVDPGLATAPPDELQLVTLPESATPALAPAPSGGDAQVHGGSHAESKPENPSSDSPASASNQKD
jgi:segregation and condensation protein B